MGIIAKLVVAPVAVAAAAWFYFTPHLVAKDMQAAANAKDSAKLAGHVNLPMLKENLKLSLNSKLGGGKGSSANPMGALGAALASAFVNPMVEALVTPDNLALMMQGENPAAAQKLSGTDTVPATAPAAQPATEITTSYESFDRFVVNAKKQGSTAQPIGLVFNRENWVNWKLVDIRLSK